MRTTPTDALRCLLQTYRPCDARERAFLSRMSELLEAPGDPLERTRFDRGHFTASAFVLAPDRHRLLMIHLHFDVRFLLRAEVWELSRGSGVKEARWLSLAEVERLNPEPAVTRVLSKLHERGCA